MISGRVENRVDKVNKPNTKLMIISVLVLTVLTISVSYSAFFDVKTQTNIHAFTTGTLSVTIDGSKALTAQKLKPTLSSALPNSETFSAPTSGYATLTVQNKGSLPADFMITISNDALTGAAGAAETDRLGLQYVIIGVYDEGAGKWIKFGSSFHTSISSITQANGAYPIFRKVINGNNTTQNYRVYIWLSDSTPVTEIGKLVYLKLNVRSTTVAGQINNNGQSITRS